MIVLDLAPPAPACAPARARVLVVDPEASRLPPLATALQLEGFAVECTAATCEALAAAERGPFDCAIVDLMMPHTNGLAFARELRRRHPGTRVVVTGPYPLSERQLARTDCGVVGFVAKPYAVAELAELLRRALASPPPAPPTARRAADEIGLDDEVVADLDKAPRSR